MNPPARDRLAVLADRLGISVRELLLRAARRAAGTGASNAPLRSAQAHSATDLLLTPVADFAKDDVDRALAAILPAPER